MSSVSLDIIPETHRDRAREALAAAFGGTPVTALASVSGGASGALTYRAEAAGRAYLLRMEGRRSPLRNPHQYTCMQIAAEAGVAPPLHYVDAETGVAIMDFLPQRPLEEFPGGTPALMRACGALLARLQSPPAFPPFIDYFNALERMLAFIRNANLFAPGLLDPHTEEFGRISAAYPRDAMAPVSSHNDPNPHNVIFNGERLWLIDWETAYRNDPLVDIAIMLDQQASTPELEAALLHAWLGRAPDRALKARLTLMRPVTRLYYASLCFTMFAGMPREKPDDDLSAPTPEEFRRMAEDGRISPAMPQTLYILGKMQLAGFLSGVSAPGFAEALAIARGG